MTRAASTTIILDAREWESFRDIYAAMLPALCAPEWHGPNLDAVYDALVAGHYRFTPPLLVTVTGVAQANEAVRAYLARLVTVFDDARADYGVAATLRVA